MTRSRLPSRLTCATVVIALAMLTACRAETVVHTMDVIGTDYALLAPDTVPAGPTVLSFENRGRVPHEMILARIRDDVSNAAFADSLVKGVRMVGLRATGSGVLFAEPGTRNDIVRVRAVFKRGERYALWCQFRDSSSAPKHTSLGMFKLLTVR